MINFLYKVSDLWRRNTPEIRTASLSKVLTSTKLSYLSLSTSLQRRGILLLFLFFAYRKQHRSSQWCTVVKEQGQGSYLVFWFCKSSLRNNPALKNYWKFPNGIKLTHRKWTLNVYYHHSTMINSWMICFLSILTF